MGLVSNKSVDKEGSSGFSTDPAIGILRRNYSSYEAYLQHQAEKLGKVGEVIVQSDLEYEKIVVDRYKDKFDFRGKSILCLGARLGGEVKAFKKLGALALGVDIEPGEKNIHVLHGDFHNLQFPDESFDFLFTNCIDHVYDLKKFLQEAARVIKPDGLFLIELGEVKIGKYEVLDTRNTSSIIKLIEESFLINDKIPIHTKTEYVDWKGYMLQMKKV